MRFNESQVLMYAWTASGFEPTTAFNAGSMATMSAAFCRSAAPMGTAPVYIIEPAPSTTSRVT